MSREKRFSSQRDHNNFATLQKCMARSLRGLGVARRQVHPASEHRQTRQCSQSLAAHPQRRGEATTLEMLMRIAQVAPPFESVPPTRYGGTERVVSLLTEELVRRGHDVTLFASGDSTTSARLVPTVDTALWRLNEVRDNLPYWTITLGEVYVRARDGDFDVVHSHLDFHTLACAALVDTPTVTTLHGRLDLPDLRRLYARFPEAGVISISYS